MITKIIILYILNVFLNRWLDYKILRVGAVKLWLIPIFSTIAILMTYVEDNYSLPKINNKLYNWFIGKHW